MAKNTSNLSRSMTMVCRPTFAASGFWGFAYCTTRILRDKHFLPFLGSHSVSSFQMTPSVLPTTFRSRPTFTLIREELGFVLRRRPQIRHIFTMVFELFFRSLCHGNQSSVVTSEHSAHVSIIFRNQFQRPRNNRSIGANNGGVNIIFCCLSGSDNPRL
jgi:hypothetical protein